VTTVAGVPGVGYVLAAPSGIALDPSNNIYVVDARNAALKLFTSGDPQNFKFIAYGNAKPEWGLSDWWPSFLAIDTNLNSFVGDVLLVAKYLQGESPQVGMARIDVGYQQFAGRPGGLVFDTSGNLYAIDSSNNALYKFAPGATSGVTIPINGDQLNQPSGIALDNQGNIFIVDTGNHRVLKFALTGGNGVVVAGGNGAGSGPTQLNGPTGIAVDTAGNIYVADTNNDRVQFFQLNGAMRKNGVPVAGGQGRGSGPEQLLGPRDVKIDNIFMLYVADTGNGRVQRWDLGEFA
jgi:tripartite motif-containing protein 71